MTMKMMRMSKAAEMAEMMAEDLMSSKMSQCRECGKMTNQVELQGTEEGEVEVHELSRKKLARELPLTVRHGSRLARQYLCVDSLGE